MNDHERATEWARRALPVILREHDEYRARDISRHVVADNGIDLIAGESLTDFGGTRAAMPITTPSEWRSVAALVMGLLDRSPLKDGPHYSGERILLGTFASELAGYALAAEAAVDAAA